MAYTQFQFRRDTAANWVSNNPILAEGEIGVETDGNRFKIGDGVTAWNSLVYPTFGIETDPVFSASASSSITTQNLTNWNTAYGWGDHAAAGYLDDYEEGTWTATFVPSNNGFTPTANISTGRYVKVGKLVTAIAVAQMTVPASLGTYVNNSTINSLDVTGLPFSIASLGTTSLRSAPSLAVSTGIATVAGTLVGEGTETTTSFSIWESKNNGSTRTGPTLTVSTTVTLRFQFTYITA